MLKTSVGAEIRCLRVVMTRVVMTQEGIVIYVIRILCGNAIVCVCLVLCMLLAIHKRH